FGFAENTDDLFVGKTLLHGDVLMWLMKTLLTSGCTNQRGAGQPGFDERQDANDLVFSESGFTHGDLLRGHYQYVGRSLKVNGSFCRDTYKLFINPHALLA
ncbi:hypothetical protein, partial [Enterobacter chengduensis]|uniref:hypothetical protein n=1 Tax=Enterobacter chengduensis TaxID=2494701 RepID=UPI001A908AE5